MARPLHFLGSAGGHEEVAVSRPFLVAAALSPRDPTAIVPFNCGSYHSAVPSRTDSDTTWPYANRGVGVIPATVSVVTVVAIPPDLNIDLGLGRSDQRG